MSRDTGIKAVAHKAGVSAAAVSRVLTDDPTMRVSSSTRERIFNVARELNYVSDARARQLGSRTSNTIGILIHGLWGTFRPTFCTTLRRDFPR